MRIAMDAIVHEYLVLSLNSVREIAMKVEEEHAREIATMRFLERMPFHILDEPPSSTFTIFICRFPFLCRSTHCASNLISDLQDHGGARRT